MKRLLPFVLALWMLIPLLTSAQTVLYNENFDSYTVGASMGTSNPTWWVPWSGTAGGTDDVKISDEKSSSSPNSIKFYAAAAQGDYDMILKLGNQTSGHFELKFKIYIGDTPTYGGYFNMLHALPTPTAEWAFSLTFDPNLDITFNHDNVPTDIGTYVKGTWLDVRVSVDLNQDSAGIFINNVHMKSWTWSIQESGGAGLKQLAGVNFFTYAGGGAGSNVLFYVDDVEYTQIVYPGIEEPVPFEWVKVYPNPTAGLVQIDVPGATEMQVYNTLGSLVGAISIQNGKADISQLPQGAYICQILTEFGVARARIVKQ